MINFDLVYLLERAQVRPIFPCAAVEMLSTS
jgi:hypothetical protein